MQDDLISRQMAIDAIGMRSGYEVMKMSDLIKRQDAIDAIAQYGSVWMEYTEVMNIDEIAERALKASNQSMIKILHDLPSAELPIKDKCAFCPHCENCDVNEGGTIERKKGEWKEKEVIHKDEATEMIEEWQSCRCSVCGRYDTRPYLYSFSEPNFCSYCGARMEVNDGKIH